MFKNCAPKFINVHDPSVPETSPSISPPGHIFTSCYQFDAFKCLLSYQRQRAAIKHARYAVSAERPPSPSRLSARARSWFCFIYSGFWLMSVTATGNKMLVRVCAVALERWLWYIVWPFAGVSWLPRRGAHVYWFGVKKARTSTYFAAFSLVKGEGLLWCRSDTFVGRRNHICCGVSVAPSFFFFCTLCVSLCLLLSLLRMNWKC